MKYVDVGRGVWKTGVWTESIHAMINHITRVTGIPYDESVVASIWILDNLNNLTCERTRALFKELRPISWDLSSSIRSRQQLVNERFKVVNAIVPFLTVTEKRLVEQWKKENRSSGLWE